MKREATREGSRLGAVLLAFALVAGCVGAAGATATVAAAADPRPAHAAAQGWKKSHGSWWYQYADGSYVRGWKAIDGAWYRFDRAGWMQTGWTRDGGRWFYLGKSGAMATGWKRISGTWYYFSTNGAMRTGWQQIDGTWYCFAPSGAMQTGWQKVSGKWYYLEPSGAMRASAWVDNTYYVQASGAMATNRWVDGGRYYVDGSGRWVPGKKKPVVPMYSQAGRLRVDGTHLVGENGKTVQLRGVSTHGLAWFPQYVSKSAFQTLRDDWGANVVRLALYTAEYGGYCTGGDKAQLEALIDKGVKAASDLGMYVIIDWHILSDGNPQTYQSQAVDFFGRMAAKYKGYGNVIYEICNEPQNSPFASVIKPYANKVLKAIRASDKQAVVLVGTNTWSQDVDEVIGKRLADPNVMYTLHFYAATHQQWNRDKLKRALDAGVPVFVSECSITDASGNGAIDRVSANAWLKLMNDNAVSYVAWSLCNKNESSALVSPASNALSGWSRGQLSETGKWWRNAIANS